MKKKKNKYDQVIAMVVLSTLTVGMIVTGESIRSKLKGDGGTPVDISTQNADLYQVKELYLLDNGNYVVHGTAKGFSSDIEAAVTFDNIGDKIISLSIISQGETEGIGTKIMDDAFLQTFVEVKAPVQIGDLEVVSPSGGEVVAAASSDAVAEAPEGYSSSEWNKGDESPEADAVRALYDAGLLTSSKENQELDTAHVDLSPEEKATAELKEANLLTSSNNVEVVSAAVDATAVDAISGATISSKAVGEVINNSYFFLQENILNK